MLNERLDDAVKRIKQASADLVSEANDKMEENVCEIVGMCAIDEFNMLREVAIAYETWERYCADRGYSATDTGEDFS